MTVPRGRSTAKQAEVVKRRGDAIALRIRGESWDSIARTLGYKGPGAACQDVSRALEQRIREQGEQADALREVELARLDALYAAAWEVLERDHLTVSGGKIVIHDERPLADDSPVLAAIDRLLKIAERRAKLLGLDADAQQMERLVELEEGKARLVAAVIERVINSSDIDLTDEQREAQRAAAVRELRALPSPGPDAHAR